MCSTEKIKEYLQLKEMKKEIDNELKAIEKEIYCDYGKEKNIVTQGEYSITINLIKRITLDTKKLKSDHPSIFKLYERETSYNTIKIKVV